MPAYGDLIWWGWVNMAIHALSDTECPSQLDQLPWPSTFNAWGGRDLDDWESTQTSVFTYFSLEAAEELGQVGVFPGQGKDPFLSEGAVHVVILQDHVFLQHFDGVHLITAFQLCQHHLVMWWLWIWFYFSDAELQAHVRRAKLTFPKLPFPRTLMKTKSCKSILLTSGAMWHLMPPFSWLPSPAAVPPSPPSCPAPLFFALMVASDEAAERGCVFFSSPWWSNERTFRMFSSSAASWQR